MTFNEYAKCVGHRIRVVLRHILPRPLRHGIAVLIFGYLRLRNRVASRFFKKLADFIVYYNLQDFVYDTPIICILRPYINIYMAMRTLRKFELGESEAYERALDLLRRCGPTNIAKFPEYALQQALECLAAYGEHDIIVAIASQFTRATHGIHPVRALLVSAACVAVRREELVDPLLAVAARDPRKPQEIARLVGVCEVRNLFRPHWSRHDPQGLVTFADPWIMGEPTNKTTTLPLPYEGCVLLESARIIGGFNIIDAEGCLAIYDIAGQPCLPHVAGLRDQVRGTALAMNRAVMMCPYSRHAHLALAIMIGGRVQSNYFHWIVEYLPRLLTAIEGGALRGTPLLVPTGMPQSMRRALEIVNRDEFQIYEYEPDTLLTIDQLLVPSMHSCVVDGLALPLSRLGALSPRHLRFVRERILQHVAQQDDEMAGSLIATPEKILLLRGRRGRALTSERAIQSELIAQGFTVIDPAKLDFEAQVRLFRDAKVIVAASGAALTNLLFCNENPVVFSLIASHILDFNLFANLLQIAGSGNFTHVAGKASISAHDSPNTEHYVHANYEIEVSDLIKSMKNMHCYH